MKRAEGIKKNVQDTVVVEDECVEPLELRESVQRANIIVREVDGVELVLKTQTCKRKRP